MKFYKRKIFYIPLLLFLLLVIIASALLYKPVKLIYWASEIFPKDVEMMREYDTLIANTSTFFANYTTFQPKLEDFQDLNKQLQTIKRDFIIMDKIGLGEVYFDSISNLVAKFHYLSKIKILFFGYPETKALNQSQMQQYQEILKNTQEIKEAISKEQFQFAQACEDFYRFIYKETDDLAYIQRVNVIRFTVNGSAIFADISHNSDCPSDKYVEIFLPGMLESYTILKELKPNGDVLRHINQNSYEEFVEKITREMMIPLQDILSNCSYQIVEKGMTSGKQ